MIFENKIEKVNYYNYGNPVTIPVEIKPCPFCGGEAEIAIKDWDNRVDEYRVKCKACDAGIPGWHLDPRIAASVWNDRILYGDNAITDNKESDDD